MSNFENALKHIWIVEGGYGDEKSNPFDRGGATNFGITHKTLSKHRGVAVTADDVKALTKDEATEIYRKFYWDHYGLGLIRDARVALIVFDQVVNRDAKKVIEGIQIKLRMRFGAAVAVDGIMGPQTIEAINATEVSRLIPELVIAAQQGYLEIVKASPDQLNNLSGWFARTWKLLRLV